MHDTEPNASARSETRARTFACLAAALSALVLMMTTVHAQQPTAASAAPASHLTIPYLANTSSDDIEFAAAECDVKDASAEMTCRFRQVFITRASFDQTACVITSNGYEQRFRRETPVRWVSTAPPEGECGRVETTTLDDGGGTRWTMSVTTRATRNADRAQCQEAAGPATRYDWRDVKRPLSCATIQPGSIER